MTAKIGMLIGASNVKKAYIYYKHILVFMFCVIIAQYSTVYVFR